MSQERQREEPQGKTPKPNNHHWLLWTIVAVFIFASIAGMMLIDRYGEARMGDGSKITDSADR
ncbi:MAG TPA: hypothetical protein VGK09_12195 [Rhodocyclaceae bacterium]